MSLRMSARSAETSPQVSAKRRVLLSRAPETGTRWERCTRQVRTMPSAFVGESLDPLQPQVGLCLTSKQALEDVKLIGSDFSFAAHLLQLVVETVTFVDLLHLVLDRVGMDLFTCLPSFCVMLPSEPSLEASQHSIRTLRAFWKGFWDSGAQSSPPTQRFQTLFPAVNKYATPGLSSHLSKDMLTYLWLIRESVASEPPSANCLAILAFKLELDRQRLCLTKAAPTT